MKKLSLRSLLLLLFSAAGTSGVVIGLIQHDRSTIVFGYVTMMVACLGFHASSSHDEKDFHDE